MQSKFTLGEKKWCVTLMAFFMFFMLIGHSVFSQETKPGADLVKTKRTPSTVAASNAEKKLDASKLKYEIVSAGNLLNNGDMVSFVKRFAQVAAAMNSTVVEEPQLPIATEAYCIPSSSFADPTGITLVSLAGFSNPSAGAGTNAGAYKDFTSQKIVVAAGSSHKVVVRVNTAGNFIVTGTLWVDWDKNETFNDAANAERLRLGYAVDGTDIVLKVNGVDTAVLDIPGGTPVGEYRMRVRVRYTSSTTTFPTPCGSVNYSEAEDYTLVVAAECSGTPEAGTLQASTLITCTGSAVNFSLAGTSEVLSLNYQWQSSANGTTWVNIPGAPNANNASFIVADTTYYRAIVTCGNSSESDTTNVLKIGLKAPIDCYCEPVGIGSNGTVGIPIFCDYDAIYKVAIGDISNSSDCSAGGFTNYGPLGVDTFVLKSGGKNKITLDVLDEYPKSVGVWIDYNRNFAYDANEFTYLGIHDWDVATIMGNIAVPDTITPGTITKMRVLLNSTEFGNEITASSACEIVSDYTGEAYGEVEDYIVTFEPCVPVVINTLASQTVNCGATTTFTVTATGDVESYKWQYKTPTGAWLDIPSGGKYSGADTKSLVITNATEDMSGYQYRVLIEGLCSAASLSSAGTLTVNKLAPVVSPSAPSICLGSVQQLSLTNLASPDIILSQNFNGLGVFDLPAGWATINKSNTLPGNIIDNYGFLSSISWTGLGWNGNSGGAADFMISNYEFAGASGADTLNTWLISPEVPIANGNVISFYARSIDDADYTDRLQLRMSTAGASLNVGNFANDPGDFSVLLVDINPNYEVGVFKNQWVKYTATIAGVPVPTTGRFAIRYFVEDGGPIGSHSVLVGVDDVEYISTPQLAKGIWTGPAGTIFTDAAATIPYDGATPTTSVFVKPTATSDYKVSYIDGDCESSSTTVKVTVSTPATVTAATTQVCAGGTAVFTSAVTGGPITTYQWQSSTDGGLTWTNISGATSATYSIANAGTAINANRYRVVVGTAGCGSVQSAAVTPNITALPVLTLGTSDATLKPGETATITAAPAGLASYTWSYNGTLMGNTTSSYVASVDGLGTYTVSGTDALGCKGANATIVLKAEESDRLWIYPNPTDGQFQVRVFFDGIARYQDGELSPHTVVNVFNSKGQRVAQQKLTWNSASGATYLQAVFDLSKNSAGTYVVRVDNYFTGKSVSGLVVVQ